MRLFLAIFYTTFLTACGGGGGSVGTAIPSNSNSPSPLLPSSTTGLQYVEMAAPVTRSQLQEYIDFHDYGPWPTYQGTIRSGVRGYQPFVSVPIVRRVDSTANPARDNHLLDYVVGVFNRHLPHSAHLRVGPYTALASRGADIVGPTIIVSFGEGNEWWSAPSANPDVSGVASNTIQGDHTTEARIWIRDHSSTRELVAVLKHEMVHALGLRGHVCNDFGLCPLDTSHLPPSILTIYTKYVSGLPTGDAYTVRHMYSPESFGEWGDASGISAHIDGVRFGFVSHTGFVTPFVTGEVAGANVGSGVWYGELVGAQPDGTLIHGDAAVRINLDAMSGSIGFTQMTWDRGDLEYDIDIVSNYFVSENKEVVGAFYSRGSVAAGTVDRTDLTAAFGAKR